MLDDHMQTLWEQDKFQRKNLMKKLSEKQRIEYYKKFQDLGDKLSPENLTHDGELSQKEVDEEHELLMKEWHKLERDVEFKVEPLLFM